jgi:crotonobetainyl-CoA:carnitine CoA-transferase CaiB-like acyl-CoA transferase
LDLSRVLAGPWAGQLLADLGAEVIKIERPNKGDDTRQWGPPYLKRRDGMDSSESAYYLCANRGKKSVTADITHTGGQNLIRQLVTDADVFIENFKVGSLQKYGLDYHSLQDVNPRLIYCSITGFGQTGPYAQRPGYDFMIQAMSGLMSITGLPDEQGGCPTKVGVAVTDILTGVYAANAIQAALIERYSSGVGQWIDMSLFDVSVASLANQATNYLVGQKVPERLGNSHPSIVPYEAFETEDGYIILAIGNDEQFRRFCQLAGLQVLIDDEAYCTNSARVQNRVELCSIIAKAIKLKASSFWLNQCETHQVPCGPINDLQQVFNDPHLDERELLKKYKHPHTDSLTLPVSPIKFSRSQINNVSHPPTLGEHTVSVLSAQGFSAEQIAWLKEQHII